MLQSIDINRTYIHCTIQDKFYANLIIIIIAIHQNTGTLGYCHELLR